MSDAQASGLPAHVGPDPRLDMAPGPREALYVPATWNLTTTAANGIAGTGVLLNNLNGAPNLGPEANAYCPMRDLGGCYCAQAAVYGDANASEDVDEDFDDDGDGGGDESPKTNPRQPMRVDEPDRELVPV